MSAADNLGYVIDMFVEPDKEGVTTLYGLHEIRGQNAIDIIERNKNISVSIEREFKDGKGVSYGEAIVHSSIVQQPVVPGQGDFEAVDSKAASRNSVADKIPVFTLSKNTRSTDMDEKTLAALKKLLGAGDDVTADNVMSRLEQRFSESAEKLTKLSETNVTLTGEIETLKASKTSEKDKTDVSKVDPNLAEQMGSTADSQLGLLVEAGKITPAVRDKLSLALVGKTGERNIMALSIGTKSEPSLLSAVVDALKENDIVLLNEKTGVQVLSRQLPGTDSPAETAKADKEVEDGMVEMAGGEPETK